MPPENTARTNAQRASRRSERQEKEEGDTSNHVVDKQKDEEDGGGGGGGKVDGKAEGEAEGESGIHPMATSTMTEDNDEVEARGSINWRAKFASLSDRFGASLRSKKKLAEDLGKLRVSNADLYYENIELHQDIKTLRRENKDLRQKIDDILLEKDDLHLEEDGEKVIVDATGGSSNIVDEQIERANKLVQEIDDTIQAQLQQISSVLSDDVAELKDPMNDIKSRCDELKKCLERVGSHSRIVDDDHRTNLRQENDRLKRELQLSKQTVRETSDGSILIDSRAAAAAASSAPSQHHKHIQDHAASGGRGNEPSRGRGVPLEVEVGGDGDSGGDYASPLSTTTRQNSGRRGSGMFRQLSLSSRRLSETVLSSPARLLCRSSRRFIYNEQDEALPKGKDLKKALRILAKDHFLLTDDAKIEEFALKVGNRRYHKWKNTKNGDSDFPTFKEKFFHAVSDQQVSDRCALMAKLLFDMELGFYSLDLCRWIQGNIGETNWEALFES